MRRQALLLLVGTCLSWSSLASLRAEDWRQFRGPAAAGKSAGTAPVSWSPGDYTWSIDLPGVGHSSPVIVGDQLFVTTAVEEGAARALFCLHAGTGELQWQRLVGHNRSNKHAKSSWASSTPVVDDQQVYVAFADKEQYTLTAWSRDGRLNWRTSLGPFESQHGLGVSPILYKDLVIAANDQDGPSSVVALNRKTGEVVWSTLRSIRRASYATPVIIDAETPSPQLICVSGAMGVTSLDPDTGKLLWSSGELPLRTVATPVVGAGLVFASCGSGGRGALLVAVETRLPEQLGDAPRIRWQRKRNLPYVPTPVFHDGRLFLWNDNGVAVCLDAKTGDEVWTARVGGKYSGSPVQIGDKLYCLSETGKVVVIGMGDKFDKLGEVDLGDPSHATPAVANGHVYFRTFHRLLALPLSSAADRN